MHDIRNRGRWVFRIAVAVNLLVGLSLLSMAAYAYERLAGDARVISTAEIASLTRENALRALSTDEGLLEAYRDMVHSLMGSVILGSVMILVATSAIAITCFRSTRRRVSGDK